MMSNKGEAFNPWSIVNLVFDHLVSQGLHPVLGETGDPSQPATELLRALGVEPGPEEPAHTRTEVGEQLAALRQAMLDRGPGDGTCHDLVHHEATNEVTQNDQVIQNTDTR